MIRAVLIELASLGDEAGGLRPGGAEALAGLGELETGPGQRLAVGLVDDGPVREGLLDRLRTAGVRDELARPGAVTTAALAGAALPDRRLFQAALVRLGVNATLPRCAVVLADARHAAACRKLRMTPLALGADFTDWRDVPVLVARAIDPANLRNLAVALRPRLRPDLEDVVVTRVEPRRIVARAGAWEALPGGGRVPRDVHVKLPVEVTVNLDDQGRVASVTMEAPAPDALAEAESYAERLFARGEVSEASPPAPGTTHVLQADERGRLLLRRARFSGAVG